MFRFEKKQEIFEIGGVRIGGQPGELPTVMIGSIFYHGQKIVRNEVTGDFDREAATRVLEKEQVLSARTGNSRIVDICASWPQAFEKLIDFVAGTIDGPFTLDGATAGVRMAGAKYVGETGLSERAIYNSISLDTKNDELNAIKDARIKSALLLTMNTNMPTISGRLQTVPELLSKAHEAGVENTLVDTTTLDIPDPGPVGKAAYLVKEMYGLPAGAGTHNAINIWNRKRRLEESQYSLASSVANVLPIAMGANFTLYGPIEVAPEAYFSCALVDAYVAYSMKQEFGSRPLTKEHPLFKIFSA
jgi:tetrahydromethanopterin S-methyltransferase subunit H